MNYKYLVSFAILIISIKSYSNSDLSLDYDKYWAQTLVGADLVRFEMKSIKNKRLVGFSIFDEDFNFSTLIQAHNETLSYIPNENYVEKDAHGNNVAYLITGSELVVSGTDQARLNHVSTIYSYKAEARKILDLRVNVELANVSHDDRPRSWIYDDSPEEIQDLLNNKIHFICSSGNYYPSPADKSSEGPCLQVGSLNYLGFVSNFSMEGSGLTILAPSDQNLASFDGAEERTFGGTSGSAPQVLAALANLYSLYPYKTIDRRLAKKLLRLTSTPLLQTSSTQKNGSGLLNSYKLFRLGLELKNTSFKNSAIDEALDSLHSEARQLLKLKTNTKEEKLLNLRRAFLLGSKSTKILASSKISQILQQSSYTYAGAFYENFSKDFRFTKKEIASFPNKDSFSYTRFWIDTEKPSNEDLKDEFSEISLNSKFAVLAEFSQTKSEREFLEAATSSQLKNSYYLDFSLGQWAQYLLEKFYREKK
jgi:hypothetical protein